MITIPNQKAPQMDPQTQAPSLIELLLSFWTETVTAASAFVTPGWRQYQVLIILGLVAISYLAKALTDGKLEDWARARQGWAKWKLRLVAQIRRRLMLAYFVVSAWGVYLIMQSATWPSRSYLIGLAATIASVWLAISLGAKLVRNRLMRRLVSWALWIYATLYYLEFLDEVTAFLDSIALEIGSLHISVLSLIIAIVMIGLMLTAARLATQLVSTSIRNNSDISPSMQVLGIKVVQVLFYGAVFLIGFKSLGFDLTGFALLSGAVGVGIGFGLQKVVSNLVSGVIILLDKSIKPGDVISLGDTFGWISTLTARYVSVVTRDGKEYLIPNEDLITGQVVNWTHSDQNVRLDLYFGTSYHDDPNRVRKIAIEAVKNVSRVQISPNLPVCHIVGFGDSSVDYTLRFWIGDPAKGLTNIKGDVYLALWNAFAANDISIPFPQREVRLLGGASQQQADDKTG